MPSGLASITQKRPAKSPACSITAAWTQVGRHLFSSRILPYFNACTTLPTPNILRYVLHTSCTIYCIGCRLSSSLSGPGLYEKPANLEQQGVSAATDNPLKTFLTTPKLSEEYAQ